MTSQQTTLVIPGASTDDAAAACRGRENEVWYLERHPEPPADWETDGKGSRLGRPP